MKRSFPKTAPLGGDAPVVSASTRRSLAAKEEREQLSREVRALEAQLDALRHLAGLPTIQDKAEVEQVQASSEVVRGRLRTNDAYLGRLDSMVVNELLMPPINPMSTFIHLPHDMAKRRDILRGMQELKLRRGVEVATAWLHDLDHTVPYLDEKGFTIASGEFHYNRLEINQFPNFRTVRQLYDTYVQFLYNQEINVTEMLGQLTLREDSEAFDPTIWNHRLVTVAENVGVPEELNLVGFAQFYSHSPATNSPMGVIVHDTVNIDDLYPYRPAERTCKDIQAVHLIFEVPKPGSKETVVVLKQLRFCVQLAPQFEVAPRALAQLQRNFCRWPNAIIQYLREYVVPI